MKKNLGILKGPVKFKKKNLLSKERHQGFLIILQTYFQITFLWTNSGHKNCTEVPIDRRVNSNYLGN